MGGWGPGLFSDDLACDVRDAYREMIEDGLDDAEATRRVVAEFGESVNDPDENPTFWLALAFTQSAIGRLDPTIRDRAVGILERGEGLHLWEHDPNLLARRKRALEKVRVQFTGPQPPRKNSARPSPMSPGWPQGTCSCIARKAGVPSFASQGFLSIDWGRIRFSSCLISKARNLPALTAWNGSRTD